MPRERSSNPKVPTNHTTNAGSRRVSQRWKRRESMEKEQETNPMETKPPDDPRGVEKSSKPVELQCFARQRYSRCRQTRSLCFVPNTNHTLYTNVLDNKVQWCKSLAMTIYTCRVWKKELNSTLVPSHRQPRNVDGSRPLLAYS